MKVKLALSLFLFMAVTCLYGMELNFEGFKDGASIPVKYVRNTIKGGENISPGLSWSSVSEGTKCFVLTCVDKAPVANNWVHWMVVNIPSDTTSVAEGAKVPGLILKNSFGTSGYGGPQPPPGTGKHEYVFTLYALKKKLTDVPDFLSAKQLLEKIRGLVISKASCSAYFER